VHMSAYAHIMHWQTLVCSESLFTDHMDLQVELELQNLSSSQSPTRSQPEPHKTRPGHGCVAAELHVQTRCAIQVVYSRPCNEIHFLSQAQNWYA
jgi:hypothetical protein